jgi:hypothetical protein
MPELLVEDLVCEVRGGGVWGKSADRGRGLAGDGGCAEQGDREDRWKELSVWEHAAHHLGLGQIFKLTGPILTRFLTAVYMRGDRDTLTAHARRHP